MADEKQLTVAELLARNGEKGKGAEGTDGSARRRRRRSLEEGGISVAELTGGLKKVEATPPESKHSDQPMDQPAPVIPAPKDASKKEAANQAASEQNAGKQDAGKQTAPAGNASRIELPAAKAEQASGPAEDDTTVLKRVDHPEPAKRAEPAAPQTTVAPRPQVAEDNTHADSAQADPAAADHPTADQTTAWNSPQEAETGEIPVVREDAQTATDGAAHDELEPAGTARDADYAGEADDDGKLNPLAVILLAVLGVVLGVLVFLGFEALWARLSKPVVALLGVAVTAAMVGVAHALRTDRDSMSMLLAAIVGLVLTFGPLLIA